MNNDFLKSITHELGTEIYNLNYLFYRQRKFNEKRQNYVKQ